MSPTPPPHPPTTHPPPTQIYEKVEVKQRSKRLFGALMGHLGKAKERLNKCVRGVCGWVCGWVGVSACVGVCMPVISRGVVVCVCVGMRRDEELLKKMTNRQSAAEEKDKTQGEEARKRLREQRIESRRGVSEGIESRQLPTRSGQLLTCPLT
jgi:hypothetical protein